jgi:3-methyl-2-oxobutanoate hydroxymethyltransferase
MPDPLDNLRNVRDGGKPVVALTAYDYPTGRLVDEAGVDVILVGDSLGMVVLGYEDTSHVSLDEMLHHTRATRRGVKRALLVGDMPYKTYETPEQALATALALRKAGADMVKLEGGREKEAELRALVEAGIPMMGHLGMLPQQVVEEGGYKKKGRSEVEAERLLADAQLLEEIGVGAIVLESLMKRVARAITESISIPTIGIGSGKGCDGQILVIHDLIGSFPWFCPPFVTPKADVAGAISSSVRSYIEEVQNR